MDKLNLSPQERRLVAGVGLVVFVMLNIWLVWPHFGDWRKIQSERDQAAIKLSRYQKEVNELPQYAVKLRELEGKGLSVAESEQDLNLANFIQSQALANKLEIITRSPPQPGASAGQTNEFFDEMSMSITYRAEPEALKNFLESLTTTNSLIRVRDKTVRLDTPPHKLTGQIVVVASYQKKPQQQAAATVAANVKTTQPVATPAPKPTNAAATVTKPKATNVTTTVTNKIAAPAPGTNKPLALPTRKLPAPVK